MLCLIGVALATLQGLPADVQEGLAKEQRGFEALGQETANIKAIQDKTRAQLAEMAKSDFFGAGAGAPSSFAQLPQALGDSQAKLARIEAEVKASQDTLDASLTNQEARARAKHAKSSLLESRHIELPTLDSSPTLDSNLKVHQHQPYVKSDKLQKEDADLLKVQAIAAQMKQRAAASHDKFADDMRRELHADDTDTKAPAASLSQSDAEEVKAEDGGSASSANDGDPGAGSQTDPEADENSSDLPEDQETDPEADENSSTLPEDQETDPEADENAELDENANLDSGAAADDPPNESLLQLRQSRAPEDPDLARIRERTHAAFEQRKEAMERKRTNEQEAMAASKAKLKELKAKLQSDHEKSAADREKWAKKEQEQMRKVKAADAKWKQIHAANTPKEPEYSAEGDPE